jgi:hypothetical protein
MDENIERAITAALKERAVDIVTAQEDGHANTADEIVFDRAVSLGRVLVSEDADMLAEATRRLRLGETFLGLVFWRQQKLPLGFVISDLELLGVAGVSEDVRDQILFLPL